MILKFTWKCKGQEKGKKYLDEGKNVGRPILDLYKIYYKAKLHNLTGISEKQNKTDHWTVTENSEKKSGLSNKWWWVNTGKT